MAPGALQANPKLGRWLIAIAVMVSAIMELVEGPVSASCPASVLQLHPHASVLLDDDAARDLALADYFRETYAGKPPWQGL